MNGKVKFFNGRFGRITSSEITSELFVHISDIVDVPCLYEGEAVEFEPLEQPQQPDDKRWKATKVKRLESLHTGTVKSFDKGHGWIIPDTGAHEVFVHHTDIVGVGFKTLEDGQSVGWFGEAVDEQGRRKTVRVHRLDQRKPLERFALLNDFDNQLKDLAETLAQKESWQYRHNPSQSGDYPILFSYLHHTFRKLQEESGKISEAVGPRGKKTACFNTGLVTERQEAIYAFFVENPNQTPPTNQNWCLHGFRKESDHDLTVFSILPDVANYFDDPADLIYDTRVNLVIDLDHVIGDNKERFPTALQASEYVLRTALDGAINAAKRRVRRNYKTAIPQYYKGQLQLLLPLCLTVPDRADLALAVTKVNLVYRASTVLTLDMAYNNARLIAKPDNEWLQP